MCLICVEFQKERMTVSEARRALGEMISTMEPDHVGEVQEMLKTAEDEAVAQQQQAGQKTP